MEVLTADAGGHVGPVPEDSWSPLNWERDRVVGAVDPGIAVDSDETSGPPPVARHPPISPSVLPCPGPGSHTEYPTRHLEEPVGAETDHRLVDQLN